MNNEKLQKVLARAGLASRREIERWITEGRVTVNGRTATVGDRVTLLAKIQVDGRPIALAEEAAETRVILYHKPEGEICTRHDPEGRRTVFQRLPRIHDGRWINIGRLDINTSGVLLFTNDGELAHRLMHPSSAIEREYAVRILGKVDQAMLKRLTEGVVLEDGKARFEHIVDSGGTGANHWYHVVVCQGRNRLVRRLWESQGVTVSRLSRVRFGSIILQKSLRPGKWWELSGNILKKIIDVSSAE